VPGLKKKEVVLKTTPLEPAGAGRTNPGSYLKSAQQLGLIGQGLGQMTTPVARKAADAGQDQESKRGRSGRRVRLKCLAPFGNGLSCRRRDVSG